MAHAHDRTLIQQLGFADPDKKSSRHEAACQYFCQQDTLRAVLGLPDLQIKDVEHEYELVKNRDSDYRAVVGYIDVRLKVEHTFVTKETGSPHHPILTYPEGKDRFIIEVKVKKVTVGEIIRQLKFYRGFLVNGSNYHMIAVIDWALTSIDAEILTQEDIWPIRLGPSFEAWLRRRDAELADVKTS